MAAKFCASYSQQKRQPCACANKYTKDTASAANFQTIFVAHIALDLKLSFAEKRLRGSAALKLRLPQLFDSIAVPSVSTDTEVCLDVHEALKVSRIKVARSKSGDEKETQLDSESSEVVFAVEEFTRFGQLLRFALPCDAFVAVAAGAEESGMEKKQLEAKVCIWYETLPTSPATTWLDPEQTHGKTKPYLFTQGQACLNRALFPCMDTPAVRFTYEARIEAPSGFTAVMSAERSSTTPQTLGDADAGSVFEFCMPQPIPSYLVALAVGDLVSRRVGPRSEVWCEPSQVDAAEFEFNGMPETYIAAGESLFGEYRWSTYDILVMPPSFPFGGMENPRMAFVTPCLLTGDRSLGDVIAHEIAHCWFGNLVTNANWSEFWLNEGFTMFAQRRITDVVHGKAFTALEAMTGRKILVDDVTKFGEEHQLTRLRCPIEAGVDPEDTYNECPYEKGFAMVSYLRHCLGSEYEESEKEFDVWLANYANRFAFTSIVAEDMFNFFFESYPAMKDKVNVDLWLHRPGMPTWLPDLSVGEELIRPVEDLLAKWERSAACDAQEDGNSTVHSDLLKEKDGVMNWVTYQRLHFLDRLLDASTGLRPEVVDQMGLEYGFLASRNAEVQYRYGLVLIKKRLAARYDYISKFLLAQGKQKYTLPLYEALIRHAVSANGSAERDLAMESWMKTKASLHPNVQRAVLQTWMAGLQS